MATEGIARIPLDLFGFLSMEERQVLVSLARGREELEILAHMEGLYEAAMSYKSVAEDDFVVFQLLTFTHYHFLFALACQMRCHLSEAYASARVAIDAALIAAFIIRERALQVPYAKREPPFDNFARYLGNQIKDGKELPHPLVAILFKQHKTASMFASHADVNSFVHRVRKTEHDGQVMMTVEYFQFARDDAERKVHTLGLFHTFIMVLDIFADFLVKEQKVVPPEWHQKLQQLGATVEERANKLKAIVKARDNAD